jgi:hypothetical protein
MAMATWDELSQSIKTWDDAVLRTATDADLDAFEAKRGFILPLSYRDFAKTFGRCTLGLGSTEFAIPSIKDSSESRYNLTYFNSMMHGFAVQDAQTPYATTKTPDIALNLVFFSSDEGGDSYGWYPKEVTDAETNEYAIYGRFDHVYRQVASSFVEYVMDYCLGAKEAALRAEVEEEDEEDYDGDRRILLVPQ